MNELPSAQFRTQYAKLTEPTVVTVNGHPIGTWLPGLPDAPRGIVPTTEFHNYELDVPDLSKLPGGGLQARQVQRDELLRRINRGK